MKARYAVLWMVPLLIVGTGLAQSGAVQSSTMQSGSASNGALLQKDAAVVGVWRGQFEGLPWATLTITDEGGRLAGAILFYLHRREPGGQISSTPSVPEPLLNPRLDGKVLTCEISHRHAHPPESLSTPPVRFRIEFTSAGHAILTNESEAGPTAALVRSDY